MAEYVEVGDIKESLVECPVCAEILDNEDHSPKLLLCCLHAICTQCVLNLIASNDNHELTCPMCRKVHHLPGGANDLPVERVMTKMVNFLKIAKGKHFPCTDCPDNGTAISHCRNCKTFLCQICENAHKRSTASRDHTIVSLQTIKSQNPKDFNTRHPCDQHPSHPLEFYCHLCDKILCISCTIVDHKDHEMSKLEQAAGEQQKLLKDLLKQLTKKTIPLTDRVKKLLDLKQSINVSEATARSQIEMYFKKMQELLNKRKRMLISNLNKLHKTYLETFDTCEASNRSLLSIIKSATDHSQDMMSKADCVETLDLYSVTSGTLKAVIENQAEYVDFTRKGIGFNPVNFSQLESLLEDVGQIQTVTFTSTTEPDNFSVDIQPLHFPHGLPGERLIVLQGHSKPVVIKCPRLEFDPVTQSKEISTSGDGVIINNLPLQSADDTGCRLKILSRAFVGRAFVEPGKHLWQVNVHQKIKQKLMKNTMYFEIALTNNPNDCNCNHAVGVSLILATLDNPDQLFFRLRYDEKILCDVPAMKNMPGEKGHTDLVFLLDMDRKRLSILDLSHRKVLHTVSDIDTSKPLFSMFNIVPESFADQTVKLLSGKKIDVSAHLIELLTKVTKF